MTTRTVYHCYVFSLRAAQAPLHLGRACHSVGTHLERLHEQQWENMDSVPHQHAV